MLTIWGEHVGEVGVVGELATPKVGARGAAHGGGHEKLICTRQGSAAGAGYVSFAQGRGGSVWQGRGAQGGVRRGEGVWVSDAHMCGVS